MVAIFSDPFLSEHVAMRGGTVLHKIHLAPASRYSEDIDLVLLTDRDSGHIRKALARVLQPVLGPPALDVLGTIRLAVRNAVLPSSVAQMKFVYSPTTPPPARMTVKAEVNFSERDLYDLDLALARPAADGTLPDPDRVVAAFREYMRRENTHVTRAFFERELAKKLVTPSFRVDTAAMLPVGYTFDLDAAANRVQAELLSRLPTE
jgi:hypothetical protein